MGKQQLTLIHMFVLVAICICSMGKLSAAADMLAPAAPVDTLATFAPPSPHVDARAYILVDANSGKILAEHQSEKSLPPASLTKIMTVYVIASALKQHQISLDDEVRVSHQAWHTPGSRMFLKEGQVVSVATLLQGVVVDSGNDASIALAEHLAGDEKKFTELMNQHAERLGMSQTHFVDATGLPAKHLYTSAKDLAILTRSLIHDFPEYYPWFKQRWMSFNNIKQPNRNRLLWRDPSVDGVKTGHTESAAFSLVASAKKGDMRLIAVVMGAPNDAARNNSAQRLLNHGFRFYHTYSLFDDRQSVVSARVWKGVTENIDISAQTPLSITIPIGSVDKLSAQTQIDGPLVAPIAAKQVVGKVTVYLGKEVIAEDPLIALSTVDIGSYIHRLADGLKMMVKRPAHNETVSIDLR